MVLPWSSTRILPSDESSASISATDPPAAEEAAEALAAADVDVTALGVAAAGVWLEPALQAARITMSGRETASSLRTRMKASWCLGFGVHTSPCAAADSKVAS